MNLKWYYWYFKAALPKSFCKDLIKYGNQKKEEIALTGGQTEKIKDGKKLKEKDFKDLKKIRDSNVTWLNEPWIYKEIQPFIHSANKSAGWNFNWDYSESCQFTKYKLNQYYDWHCDSWEEPYGNEHDTNFKGKIRKLSVTCCLSDPNDYEGGELEFNFRNTSKKENNIRTCEEIREQGSICVFPSFVWHRVKPVTKGTRYSLVVWNIGQPFK